MAKTACDIPCNVSILYLNLEDMRPMKCEPSQMVREDKPSHLPETNKKKLFSSDDDTGTSKFCSR